MTALIFRLCPSCYRSTSIVQLGKFTATVSLAIKLITPPLRLGTCGHRLIQKHPAEEPLQLREGKQPQLNRNVSKDGTANPTASQNKKNKRKTRRTHNKHPC